MPVTPRYRPAPRYATLGEGFADPVRPAQFALEKQRFWNDRWAARVGLGELLLCLGLSSVVWVTVEIEKYWRRGRHRDTLRC